MKDDDKSLEMQADILANSVTQGFPEDAIRDIVDQAISSDDTMREKLETSFNSGVYSGARVAFLSALHQEHETLALIKQTIEACDAAIQSVDNADFMMAVSAIRSPLALFFQEQDRRFQTAVAAQMGTMFNIPTELIRDNRPTSEIPREVVIKIGAENASEHGAMFFAYLTQFDKPGLKCRCPGHLMEAFQAGALNLEAVRDSLERKFPEMDDAMYAFGRYLVDFCRQQFAKNVQSHFDVSAVSETEAGKMAQEFIANLKLKPGDQT